MAKAVACDGKTFSVVFRITRAASKKLDGDTLMRRMKNQACKIAGATNFQIKKLWVISRSKTGRRN